MARDGAAGPPAHPCDRIGPVLGPQQNLVRHNWALPHRGVAPVETVRASGTVPAVKLAFEYLVLTAARSGEVGSRRGPRSTRPAWCGRFRPHG